MADCHAFSSIFCNRDISVFLALKTFPATVDLLDLGGAFYLNGFVVLAGVMLAWMFLPETKDKTLTELDCLIAGEKDREAYSVIE